MGWAVLAPQAASYQVGRDGVLSKTDFADVPNRPFLATRFEDSMKRWSKLVEKGTAENWTDGEMLLAEELARLARNGENAPISLLDEKSALAKTLRAKLGEDGKTFEGPLTAKALIAALEARKLKDLPNETPTELAGTLRLEAARRLEPGSSVGRAFVSDASRLLALYPVDADDKVVEGLPAALEKAIRETRAEKAQQKEPVTVVDLKKFIRDSPDAAAALVTGNDIPAASLALGTLRRELNSTPGARLGAVAVADAIDEVGRAGKALGLKPPPLDQIVLPDALQPPRPRFSNAPPVTAAQAPTIRAAPPQFVQRAPLGPPAPQPKLRTTPPDDAVLSEEALVDCAKQLPEAAAPTYQATIFSKVSAAQCGGSFVSDDKGIDMGNGMKRVVWATAEHCVPPQPAPTGFRIRGVGDVTSFAVVRQPGQADFATVVMDIPASVADRLTYVKPAQKEDVSSFSIGLLGLNPERHKAGTPSTVAVSTTPQKSGFSRYSIFDGSGANGVVQGDSGSPFLQVTPSSDGLSCQVRYAGALSSGFFSVGPNGKPVGAAQRGQLASDSSLSFLSAVLKSVRGIAPADDEDPDAVPARFLAQAPQGPKKEFHGARPQ